MKTILHKSPGFARLGTLVIAAFGLGVAGVIASPSVNLSLAGEEFGKGKTIDINSGAFRLTPAKAYAFKLQGTCVGTGALASLTPKPITIVSFLNLIKPGSGTALAGTYANPSGKLPILVIDKTISGTRVIPNYGTVTISARLKGGTLANGQVYFKVDKVNFTSTKPGPLGTILFKSGAKLAINRAPEIQFVTQLVPVGESDGSVNVRVSRYGFSKGKVTVLYATAPGTAPATDFTGQSGTLTFASGDLEETITIPITPNSTPEGLRKFSITLSSPGGGAVLGTRTVCNVKIEDDD